MTILGINSGRDMYGTLAFCGGATLLMPDGQAWAVAEDRCNRKRYSGGYRSSVQSLLDETGTKPEEVREVVISFFRHPADPTSRWAIAERGQIGSLCPNARISVMPSHHEAHAYASFLPSPFDEAIVLVADDEGSVLEGSAVTPVQLLASETTSIYVGRGSSVELLSRETDGSGDCGIGKLYGWFTRYVGFRNYLEAGKLMGLAGYGSIPQEWSKLDFFLPSERGMASVIRRNEQLLGIYRLLSSSGLRPPKIGGNGSWKNSEYQGIAALAQAVLEDYLCRIIENASVATGIKNVCLSGGVALNSLAASRLERQCGVKVFVPGFPSDEGQSMGCALARGILAYPDLRGMLCGRNTYLGPKYSPSAIAQAIDLLIRRFGWTKFDESDGSSNQSRLAASLLVSGAIVGRFCGRSEYGARALGHRSLLADARLLNNRDRLNLLKGREAFRPVAPVSTEAGARQYFEDSASLLYDNMSGVTVVRPEFRSAIPAVVHVDGTARLQVVRRADQSGLHDVLEEFEAITAVPVLANTSFNGPGEPIVESPLDAARAAQALGLDILWIEDVILGNPMWTRSPSTGAN